MNIKVGCFLLSKHCNKRIGKEKDWLIKHLLSICLMDKYTKDILFYIGNIYEKCKKQLNQIKSSKTKVPS